MQFTPAVSTIAMAIQLSVAPVFLLAGIGAVLNVIAGRLARVIDRARTLERLHHASSGAEHDRHVWELRQLDKRMSVINAALFLCVSSAVAVCSLVALLFVAELTNLHIGPVVAVIFILATALLVCGLVLFMVEVRLSLRATRVRVELLEVDKK